MADANGTAVPGAGKRDKAGATASAVPWVSRGAGQRGTSLKKHAKHP